MAVGGLAWMPLGEEKDRTFTYIWRRLSDLGNHEPEGLLPLFPMVFKKSAYTKTKYVLDSVVLLEHKKLKICFESKKNYKTYMQLGACRLSCL